MRYFNLKREELGALLYAMNFFPEAIYSIGFGKPYGFGQVTIELSGNDEMETLKQEFIQEISSKIADYADSRQLHELKEMMTLHPEKEHLLEYMSLAEYNAHREDSSHLPYYSELEAAIIKEEEEEKKQEALQETATAPQPQKAKEPEGQLAVITLFDKVGRMARLEEGNDRNPKPLVIPDENSQNGKDKIKILKKKSPGCRVRVKKSDDGKKLILIKIEQ